MNQSDTTGQAQEFQLEEYSVKPELHLICGPHGDVHVEPQVMRLLVLLAGSPREVVTRDRIVESVWHGQPGADQLISVAIHKLRHALGDKSGKPRFIQTVPKSGYRLLISPQFGPGSHFLDGLRRNHRSIAYLLTTVVVVLVLALVARRVDWDNTRAPVTEQRTIAVLPFVNMSADSDKEYFSDGLSEELLNVLAKVPELRVAARTSSFSYKNRDVSISQIGADLNVTHVLEGSVRWSGDHVRITAQLIKVSNGFHLWSATFDRTLDDVFVVQSEIAKAVVDELSINLLGTMPVVRKTDPEVYSLYLQANFFLNLQGRENVIKALMALKQALAIDPDYAPAWVSLSWAYESQIIANPATRKELLAPRDEALERALAIDENLADAWASLAYKKEIYDSDWKGAQVAVDRALELEPNNAGVVGAAAWIATSSGRLSEAIRLYEKAILLDPLSLDSLLELGDRYLRVGRIDDAFDAFNRVRTLQPDHPRVSLLLGRVHMIRGDLETALFETEKSPDAFFHPHQKATVLYMMGKETEAQIIVNDLLITSAKVAPGAVAVLYAWRGEGDSAFEWLERAYEQNEASPYVFLGSLFWRQLTGDPRYSAYVEKIGLLEEWRAMPLEYGGPPASLSGTTAEG